MPPNASSPLRRLISERVRTNPVHS